MPLYDYQCQGCGKQMTLRKSIADRHEPESNPCQECGSEIKMLVGCPKIVSGVKGPGSAPDGFKDVLRTIKKGSGKENTIDV